MRRLYAIAVLAALVAACGSGDTLPDDWSRAYQDPVLDGDLDQQMRAVIATDAGLVAVGVDESGGDHDAAVWTSADGMAWTRVPHDETIFGGPDNEWLWDVTTGPDALVAVGFGGPPEAQHAVVWTSADGATWQRVAHDPAVFGDDGGAVMLGVAAGPDGFVAVGAIGSPEMDAAVWTSPDGTTWTRVPDNDAVLGGGGIQSVSAVAWTGDRFVAVGLEDDDAAVWISTDGTGWERVADPGGMFGGGIGSTAMRAVTTGGPGLVAVGSGWAVDRPAVVVWTSPDGVAWTRVEHDEAVFGGLGPPLVMSVAAGRGGVIAVGFDGEPDGVGDVALWTSPDGLTWTRVDSDTLRATSGQYAYDLAFYDGKVFVVGTDVTIIGVGVTDGRAAVWVGE